MYTKVYACACGWSSCVSVYFLIRYWVMWSYIFWYGCVKGFSMYAFALVVNHFIVSRTYSVRYWLHLRVDGEGQRAYIIYVRGIHETVWCCRRVVGFAGTRTMLLWILWVGLGIHTEYMLARSWRECAGWLACVIYIWWIGGLFMYTNTDKVIDIICAGMWVAMLYMLIAW